jgi:hypothetical protein
VGTIGSIVTVPLTVYALVTLIFLVSESRRPQATPAWMLVFFFVSGLGLVIYVAPPHVRHQASSRLDAQVGLPHARPAAEGPASPWAGPELF